MLSLPATARVYLAVGATDLRKSFDGLFALVRHSLALDPLTGAIFVFVNRRRLVRLLDLYGAAPLECALRGGRRP